MDTDPYANDPGRWAHSLVHLAEIIVPCLDAAGARSVVEVGAYAGDLTRVLADWATGAGAQVFAIDPSPQEGLLQLADERDEVELVRETSVEALLHIPLADVVVIDGDHNWYTVTEELRLVTERAGGGTLPLLLFHDVCWPHGRRDDYFAAEQIPEAYRQPIAEGGGLFPGVTGIRPGGLPYRGAAAEEGGPRNGVLTAVEDFVAGRDDLQVAIVPLFFGLGAVWQRDAPWAQAVAAVLAPWDRNPLLERLEANRVLHLAVAHLHFVEASRCQERAAKRGAVLQRMLDSSAFAVAERLSRLRQRAGIARAHSVVSKDEIRRALAD
jgi:SAM-dependent methyltransferase